MTPTHSKYWLSLVAMVIVVIGCDVTPITPVQLPVVTAIPTISRADIDKVDTLIPDHASAIALRDNISRPPCNILSDTHAILPYEPSQLAPINFVNDSFLRDGIPFVIHGLTYFPMLTPFTTFISQSDHDTIASELKLMTDANINTLRIFISQADLFTCTDDTVQINGENLYRLDAIIAQIAENGLYMIPVLNVDVPPAQIYDKSTLAQMSFLMTRYGVDDAILAWDILDQGDTDYNDFGQGTVLQWLFDSIQTLRKAHPDAVFTATWNDGSESTSPMVDFISFQYGGEYKPLREKIAILKANTHKPILINLRYSTANMDETAQRNLIYQAIQESQYNDFLGWMVFMAFDYPRTTHCYQWHCPVDPDTIYRYGVWNTSYFPKLAVEVIRKVH